MLITRILITKFLKVTKLYFVKLGNSIIQISLTDTRRVSRV